MFTTEQQQINITAVVLRGSGIAYEHDEADNYNKQYRVDYCNNRFHISYRVNQKNRRWCREGVAFQTINEAIEHIQDVVRLSKMTDEELDQACPF